MGLDGATHWVRFKREEETFRRFLGDVADVLAGAEPVNVRDANGASTCRWSGRRSRFHPIAFSGIAPSPSARHWLSYSSSRQCS